MKQHSGVRSAMDHSLSSCVRARSGTTMASTTSVRNTMLQNQIRPLPALRQTESRGDLAGAQLWSMLVSISGQVAAIC
jgi:hypothetical protein